MAPDGDHVTVVGAAAEDVPLPAADRPGRRLCRCMGTTVGDLEDAWAKGYTELELLKRATYAGIGTCQGAPACPTSVPGSTRGPARSPTRSRPARRARSPSPRPPPTRRRCLPPDAAPRRAPRPWRPDGPVRRLVAAVALRRRRRGVLGGPRGRLHRRRLDPRQARRQRTGRRGGAGADLSVPRRGHQARPIALRPAAQRARPRHGRRDDPARVGDPVRAHLHVRRRGQRRDVAPRLDRHVGPPRPRHGSDDVARRDQRHGAARRGAAARVSGSPSRRASCATPTPRSPRSHATSCACRSRARPPGSSITR